jgi:hypothetical protein
MVASSINPEPAMTTQPNALDTSLQRMSMVFDKTEALRELAALPSLRMADPWALCDPNVPRRSSHRRCG